MLKTSFLPLTLFNSDIYLSDDNDAVCDYLESESKKRYFVYPDVFLRRGHKDPSRIAIVTQLSYSRLDRLALMADSWKGMDTLN